MLTPIVGGASDRTGRKVMLFACAALSFVLAYPLFMLLRAYPTFCRVRYTALSVSYGFAVTIFGGFAPLISTGLVHLTGDPMSPAFYVMFAGLVSGIAVRFVRERTYAPPWLDPLGLTPLA